MEVIAGSEIKKKWVVGSKAKNFQDNNAKESEFYSVAYGKL